MNCIEVILLKDRTDGLVIDAVGISDLATIADEDSSSDFLVELALHLVLEPRNDVEVGNVDDVVAIELLLLVDRRGGRRTGQKLDDLFGLLLGLLRVALGSGFIVADVREDRLNAGEGRVLGSIHDDRNPRLIAVESDGLIRDALGIGEEVTDVLNTVISVLQLVEKGGVVSLGRLNQLGESCVRQRVLGGLVALKDIVLHIFLGFFVGLFGVFRLPIDGSSDEVINGLELLFGECRKDLTDGLVLIGGLIFGVRFLGALEVFV